MTKTTDLVVSACNLAGPTCEGTTWQCASCKEHFCQVHSHTTELGHNKECVACERERKDAKLLDAEDAIERLVARTDVTDRLDVQDK